MAMTDAATQTADPPAYQSPDWEGGNGNWNPPHHHHHLTVFKTFRETLNHKPNSVNSADDPTNHPKPSVVATRTPAGLHLRQRFDRLIPPNETFFGRTRRFCLIASTILFLCLLALIIGLAAGLSSHHHANRYLPLPGTTTPITGDLTYYAPGLGSCGWTSTETDMICAVSHTLYDAVQVGSDPNTNPLCGRTIRVTRNGKSVDVKVVDRCTGCKPNDVDLSPGAFERVALIPEGRVTGVWGWL